MAERTRETQAGASDEARDCEASEIRVGDTFISFAGPRIITAIERPKPGRLKLVWRDGGADLNETDEIRARGGTS